MRAVFPKLMAGGLLLAGLAYPALSLSQYGQARPAPAAPEPMPAHPMEQAAPAAPQAQAPQAQRPSVRDLIKGRENEPAEKVFKNVQLLKGVPAGRFLDAMEGFTKALGTKCRECHDTENFASDDKDEKKAARGMVQMTKAINEQYIKTMPGLDRDAFVSCYTCHHGKTHPAGRPDDEKEQREQPEGKPR